MGEINSKLRSQQDAFFAFWCPGCEHAHAVPANRGWSWDGNAAAPTVEPSLNVTSGHYCPDFRMGNGWCWCGHDPSTPPAERTPLSCTRCHTFIRNGNIEFLGDCTHKLAGQTVPIPDYPF